MAGDEGASGEVEDQAAIHFLVEVEVEVVEGLLGVAELGLLFPPLQQALAATGEFVGAQAGDQVDGGERFALRLAQTSLQRGGHTAQTKLFERTIEFDEIHGSSSWVRWLMRSRYFTSSRMRGSTCCKLSGACGQRSR